MDEPDDHELGCPSWHLAATRFRLLDRHCRRARPHLVRAIKQISDSHPKPDWKQAREPLQQARAALRDHLPATARAEIEACRGELPARPELLNLSVAEDLDVTLTKLPPEVVRLQEEALAAKYHVWQDVWELVDRRFITPMARELGNLVPGPADVDLWLNGWLVGYRAEPSHNGWRAYVARCARNRCRDLWRKANKKAPPARRKDSPPKACPSARRADGQEAEALLELLAEGALTTVQVEVLYDYADEHPEAEIARRYELTEEEVRTILEHVRALVAQRLRRRGEPEE